MTELVGMILIVLGLAELVVGGISWTDEKTVVEAGPVEVSAKEKNWIAGPPIAGVIAVIAGVVLVGYGLRSDRRK